MADSENLQKTDTVVKSAGWRARSKEIVFFTCVAGMSILGGFSATLALAKKKDPGYFAKGLAGSREIPESGGSLALRALGRGSLYAVGGFSLFCLAAWKLSGFTTMEEFRSRMRQILPSMRKNEPQGRSEFSSVRELVHYLLSEDERVKSERSKPSS